MRASWEWRGFWAADTHADFEKLASTLAGRLGVEVSPLAFVQDVYLVVPDMPHNLKIRRGVLELKVRLQRLPYGFSSWEDKRTWRFPISGDDTARLASWLPERCRPAIVPFGSAEQLISHLQQRDPGLTVVPVAKHRVRLRRGQARLELARLEFPGGIQLLSACADGYVLGNVRELVSRSRLPINARAMGYVELLQQGPTWLLRTSDSEQAAA